MATFSIENFGCRATQADAAAIERQLRASGLARVREHSQAEIVVLNTCTVTAAADAQARDAIRHVRAANPGARILVSGCYAQRAPEELAKLAGVEWVVGNSHLAEIPGILSALLQTQAAVPGADSSSLVPVAALAAGEMSLARGPAKILTSDIFAQSVVLTGPASGEDGEHTRPTLKIQDGCNHRCSYCVIPFVRGNSRSLTPDRVVDEVRSLISAGAREIVLSGINLGSYGRDFSPRASLQSVLRRILDETALDRLRLSSIEPMDVTEDLLRFIAVEPRIAQHLHMPLQSASDRILHAMHRWYRAEHYERRIDLIREFLPDAAIGADVIVGFPDETKGDFAATRAFIERLPFAYLHVFSFSPRPGTAAANLSHPVAPAEIRDRARQLRALSAEKAAEFRATQSGRPHRALTLNRQGADWTESLTGNYLKVKIPGCHAANQWHQVSIEPIP
ncbi:MAG: tRNA (N(6)-L-threonylcarbamoyladenosine(37)-C(2))-methylthiotransferase MtaB [Candidatus Acidiferrales bacterium]